VISPLKLAFPSQNHVFHGWSHFEVWIWSIKTLFMMFLTLKHILKWFSEQVKAKKQN